MKDSAKKASLNAYSPYSNILVGASVLSGDGKIYSGCNVENISYGGTICAERVAITKAISEGNRVIKKLALYTKELWAPCGMCLQVMSEFMDPDSEVILFSDTKEIVLKFKELMPRKCDLETYTKLSKNDAKNL
jgi:cytidine deaminase